jgi:hypothetical protein
LWLGGSFRGVEGALRGNVERVLDQFAHNQVGRLADRPGAAAHQEKAREQE